jgi:hypothetical protein
VASLLKLLFGLRRFENVISGAQRGQVLRSWVSI